MNRKECLLWLSSLGAGHRTVRNIENYFDDVTEILDCKTEELQYCGIRSSKKKKLIIEKDWIKFEKYKEKMKSLDIGYVTIEDEGYPAYLKNIPDPPIILYYKGNLNNISENAIGIVGARKATPIGKSFARTLGRELAIKDISVISGMAYGIDTEAHKGAVESRGITIGVLGCGLDFDYPTGNSKLKDEIIELGGAIISEFPVGMAPLASNFPQRNRIISGMSKGVIIVEAGLKSGSLITADYAIGQDRDVFSVPGSVMSSVSQGTNRLIKQGATPITCTEDIFDFYGYQLSSSKVEENIFELLSETEKKICLFVQKNQPVLIDEIAINTRISMENLLPCITMLEIRNVLKKVGNRIAIVDKYGA